jgi:UDP-N-acetyl-D-mannosaminuronic acid dehydrogenase
MIAIDDDGGTTSLYETTLSDESCTKAFNTGSVPVAIYGLGKIGLPLAGVYAETCGNVTGVDVDPTVVESVNAGNCPVSGEPGLPKLVEQIADNDKLQATTDIAKAASGACIHVVIVPTLLTDDQEPDLSILKSLLRDLSQHLNSGDLVFIESTVPPGACREVLNPLLEEESGLQIGEFGLAFCPERTSSGRALKDIRGAYPKVVGGVDAASTRAARIVYESINETGAIAVANATTAEMVKITEGLYRDVNIALVNELASVSDNLSVDFREVTNAANTIPFINVHEPGAGVGGHCIPYYPYFVMNWLDDDFPLLRTAREQNDAMPNFTIDQMKTQLTSVGKSLERSRVLVLGVAYKPGVAETRATPAEPIIDELTESASEVLVSDPVLTEKETGAFGGTVLPVTSIQKTNPDAVVIVTAHKEFTEINWNMFNPMVIINGRQSMSIDSERHRVYTIGAGTESEGNI